MKGLKKMQGGTDRRHEDGVSRVVVRGGGLLYGMGMKEGGRGEGIEALGGGDGQVWGDVVVGRRMRRVDDGRGVMDDDDEFIGKGEGNIGVIEGVFEEGGRRGDGGVGEVEEVRWEGGLGVEGEGEEEAVEGAAAEWEGNIGGGFRDWGHRVRVL